MAVRDRVTRNRGTQLWRLDWRYGLEAIGPSQTIVTLTYDWSAVSPHVREYFQFPPFENDHLDNSLKHLASIATRNTAS